MDAQQAREIEALIPNLRRYARVLVRDADLADDLVQDCLERAVSRFDTYTQDTNLRGWLFTILLNVVRTHGRKARLRKVVPIDDYLDRFRSPGNQGDALRLRDLQRAFRQLPGSFQEVVILVAMEGMSYEEAAAVIDVPVGTVRSRLSRARTQLRGLMDEAAPETGAARASSRAAEGDRDPFFAPALAAAS
jgi:RNA polymerase sigma-70 factor, ECF subfamily